MIINITTVDQLLFCTGYTRTVEHNKHVLLNTGTEINVCTVLLYHISDEKGLLTIQHMCGQYSSTHDSSLQHDECAAKNETIMIQVLRLNKV